MADTDQSVSEHIEQLVAEEHRLLDHASEGGRGLSEAEAHRLENARVELDRLWDLLRQRRARREFGEDPNQATERDASVVEHYRQ